MHATLRPPMRIAVIGAGAVGGALAALLARAGHTVEVTARGAHLEAIWEHGIHLTGAWGDYVAEVEAGETLTRSPELAIVATKAGDARSAIAENAGVLRGIPLVVIQNGLDSLANAREEAPRSDIVGGLATFATSYLSPGEITVTTAGALYVGVAFGDDLPARYAARTLNEALPTTVIPNFTGAQWTKLVINQINALPAITGLSVQAVVRIGRLRRLMTSSMRECVRIGYANSIRFEKLQGLGPKGLRLFSILPVWIGQALPALMSARIGRVPNPGSTLQSIRRGQPTEVDYLNGSVVRAAETVGRVSPLNALMVTLVHEVETSGSFFTPEAVLERAKLAGV